MEKMNRESGFMVLDNERILIRLANPSHAVPKDGSPLSLRQRVKLVLHEIFAGHQDFLGLTPD
jgi:hypothetical protein